VISPLFSSEGYCSARLQRLEWQNQRHSYT
jgi:hypothetical protein